MTDAMLLATLKSHMTAVCGKLIDTANPPQSALITILNGTCPAIVAKTVGADRMPFNCTPGGFPDCVSPADVATLQQWIASGAPQ
jgi:hypothetical protein